MSLLHYYKDFLPLDYYKELHHILIKYRNKCDSFYPTNWPKKLIDNYKLPKKKLLNDKELNKFVFYLEKTGKIEIGLKWYIMVYYYYENSGMNWHNDGTHTKSFTFYVNKNWNEDWGGEFMWKAGNENGFFKPTGNSLIILAPPFLHKVNPIIKSKTIRITIQGFAVNDPKKNYPPMKSERFKDGTFF
jgi:Rps23 Pro-64 3,4-dihydroxylase Tpa1-like proline 4-hydroxylase